MQANCSSWKLYKWQIPASGAFIKHASPFDPLASHTANNMNSTLPPVSFQSSCFKLQAPAPQPRLLQLSRQQETSRAHTKKQGLPGRKPIHSALGAADRYGGLNKDNHRDRGATLPSSPLSDVIHEFYSSLNDKNSKRLDSLIAPDCIVEDTAYYKPLDVKVYFLISAFHHPITSAWSIKLLAYA